MDADGLKQLNPPDRPGVYLMRDDHSKIIYVGKAISLRKRLHSYFRSKDKLDPKTQALVGKIASIEFMVTDSEVEALILENTLIKKHRPRYNVVMRDDKSYPYIKLTTQEQFPRLVVTRKPFSDESKYFGPFVAVGPLKEAARSISRHFRLCQTKQTVIPGKTAKRVCLYYQMGQCDGACMEKIDAQTYGRYVEKAIDFLQGGNDPISPELEKNMEKAALEQNFELAASVRDQLDIIKRIRHQPTVASTMREDRDIFGLARSGTAATVEVFYVRRGNLEGRRHYYLQGTGTHTNEEILSQMITQYYTQPVPIPPTIVVAKMPEDLRVIQHWLETQQAGKITIHQPETPEETRLLQMAETNAWLYLKHNAVGNTGELTDEDRKILLDLGERLNLSGPPLRVECYDISNISGQDAVGSQVVFQNGHPQKSSYRKYKIKTIDGPNDFAMMQEVLFRRLKRLKENSEAPPDLIVVDGGAGQLSAARSVLAELDLLHLPIIGLAKKEEEIYLPGQTETLMLPRNSQALRFLTRLRDEAHRFAITYHRKVRSRRMTLSDLDQVRGLGKEKRRAILRMFGSVESLLQVSPDELAKVEGIGKSLALRIQQTLRKIRS